jgi:serine/threonine protein kinase
MFEPGAMLGSYEVIRLAASGATCDVYEAYEIGRARHVAIKVLNDDWWDTEDIRARFANEAHLLGSIRHRHVVALLATGHLPTGAPFMVLEWFPNQLAEVLAQRGSALEVSTAIGIARQIARGLVALHEHRIVHRDLKAANVLLSEPDLARARACLADLGLSKVPEHVEGVPVLEHVSTGGSARLGTWDYMAPEQWIKAKTVSPKADVYSLGVLLYVMLTGRFPFSAAEAKDLKFFHLFELPMMDPMAGYAPPNIVELVARMLEKTAARRPCMAEVVELLSSFE